MNLKGKYTFELFTILKVKALLMTLQVVLNCVDGSFNNIQRLTYSQHDQVNILQQFEVSFPLHTSVIYLLFLIAFHLLSPSDISLTSPIHLFPLPISTQAPLLPIPQFCYLSYRFLPVSLTVICCIQTNKLCQNKTYINIYNILT